MRKIVLDMMGGDLGLEATIPAVKRALEEFKDIEFYCIGDEGKLKEAFGDKVKIVKSSEVMKMDVDVMSALRNENTSMYVGIKTAMEIKADCFVTCGSTGGLLSLATVKVRNIPGIKRAALCSQIPNLKGGYTFCLDVGASTENSPEEINAFANMGSLFYKLVLKGSDNPRVGLLSNGAEAHKGTPNIIKAHEVLEQNKSINFIGNVEPGSPMTGEVDVIVSDGFSGNVMVKSLEGTVQVMKKLIKKIFTTNAVTKFGYLFEKKALNKTLKGFSSHEVGGAVLLGPNMNIVKGHGNSDEASFFGSIRLGVKLANSDLIDKIKEGINEKK